MLKNAMSPFYSLIHTFGFLLFSDKPHPKIDAAPDAGNHASDVGALMAIASDYVAEALDKQLGGDVTDASIFRAHAAKYEVCG